MNHGSERINVLKRIENRELSVEQGLETLESLRNNNGEDHGSTASGLLYYQNRWELSPSGTGEGGGPARLAGEPAPLLVFDGDDRLYRPILEKSGTGTATDLGIYLIKPGTGFEKKQEGVYTLDLSSEDDLNRLVADLRTRTRSPFNIIFNSPAGKETEAPGTSPGPGRLLNALIRLVRVLVATEKQTDVRLLYVFGAETPESSVGRCLDEAMGGFLKTVRLEKPNFIFKSVRLENKVDADGVESRAGFLLDEFHPDRDDATEIRFDGRRYVRRMAEVGSPGQAAPDRDSAGDVRIKENGVYVITGGLGKLGLIFAGYLARNYRARLALISRSGLRPGQEALVRHLKALGGNVLCPKADLGDPESLSTAVSEVLDHYGHINGIIHGAGLIRDSLIVNKSLEAVERVIAPKVSGTLLLDRLTKDMPLDFFAAFSSVASVIGNVGQADYAFANGFMDAYMAYREQRRAKGERTGKSVSVNWPLWLDGGMDTDPATLASLEKMGIVPLSTRNGIKAFEASLQTRSSQVIVAEGFRPAVNAAMGTDRKRRIDPPSRTVPPQKKGGDGEKELYRQTLGYLKELLSKEINIPVPKLNSTEPFETFGVNSVMIIKMTRVLELNFGELPKTLFFEYQSLDELTRYFLEHHRHILEKSYRRESPAPRPEPSFASREKQASKLPGPVRHKSGSGPPGETVAIIGLSGQYPKANTLEAFWANLVNGEDCIEEIPKKRWDNDLFYDPTKTTLGKIYSKWGGFIENMDKFDPLFFNMSPKEAHLIDPQERLFMELVWHVVEDAGYTRKSLKNSKVGVYAGVMWGQYQLIRHHIGKVEVSPQSSYAAIVNRVSYFFDFHGPSIALDTMCSSSMTALYLAYEGLRSGQIDVAVAGGVNITIHPNKYVQLSAGQFTSSDGRCRSFGKGGDGYVPSEGVGAVLLKPLSRAVADNDQIYGVIRGIGINHGGKTNGYTVPNPNAQTDLIVDVFQKAGLSPMDINYLEAHGTGTALGDPVEITGLMNAFKKLDGERALPKKAIPIGSVKSNIGHCESAAGIAALTKVLLQMKHKTLVPSIHSRELNPNINFDKTPFYVQQALSRWKAPVSEDGGGNEKTYPLRAGISSFGAGGSNAFVLVEAWETNTPAGRPFSGDQLIVLSARTEKSLQTYVDNFLEFLAPELSLDRLSGPAADAGASPLLLEDIAYTLQVGREPMAERLCMIVSSVADLSEKLRAYIRSDGAVDNLYLGNSREVSDETAYEYGESPEEMAAAAMRRMDLDRLARLWVSAIDIDWREMYVHSTPKRVSLPLYPFDNKPSWIDLMTTIEIQEEINKKKKKNIPLKAAGNIQQQTGPESAGAGARRLKISLKDVNTAGVPGRERPHTVDGPLAKPPEKKKPEAPRSGSAGLQGRGDRNALRGKIQKELKEKLAAILMLDMGEIDENMPFQEYGVDSVAVVEFINTIKKAFSLSLDATVLYDHSTLGKLASYLVRQMGTGQEEPDGEKHRNPEAQPEKAPAGPTRVERPQDASCDDIAIIGMSCRFPGAQNIDAFWENLKNGVDAVTPIPEQRLNQRERDFFNSTGPFPGAGCKWGGFIGDIDKFDPLFFRISPADAQLMDPHQRLFLEECVKAFEDAGYPDEKLDNTLCGVSVGVVNNNEYMRLLSSGLGRGGTRNPMLGNANSILASRISYYLNLKGPAVSVDTACSSSLVAIHNACTSLRNHETDMMVSGGVLLCLTSQRFLSAGQTGVLSNTGKCYTFDDRADGYVPGEGVGVLILKRYSDALKDNDHVYALIKGSLLNQDGSSNGITAPSMAAQKELELAVYNRYHINPKDISYVEAHGTGTKLGDPIEIRALTEAFQAYTFQKQYCAVGSVKTNIGHASAAAGVAGVIKTALSLKHKMLVPSLNYQNANEHIDFAGSPFYVNTRLKQWDAGENAARTAAVSSFGLSGTNCHLVMQEAPPDRHRSRGGAAPCFLIPFSAKHKDSLDKMMENFSIWLSENRDAVSIEDMSYTLVTGRTIHPFRTVIVARDVDQLQRILSPGEGENNPDKRFTNQDHADRVETSPSFLELGAGILEEFRSGRHLSPDTYAKKLAVLADLFARGCPLDWERLFDQWDCRKISLPAYPFLKDSYWFLPGDDAFRGNSRDPEAPAARPSRLHPLLDAHIREPDGPGFSACLRGDEFYLADHMINNEKIYPAVAFLEMARAAGTIEGNAPIAKIKNAVFAQPLTWRDAERKVQILLSRNHGDLEYKVVTRDENRAEQLHSQGKLIFGQSAGAGDGLHPIDIDSVKNRCEGPLSGSKVYKLFRAIGVQYGPCFQSIQALYYNRDESLSRLALPEKLLDQSGEYMLHPTFMDGALQTVIGMALGEGQTGDEPTYLPFVLGDVEIIRPIPARCYAYAVKAGHLGQKSNDVMKFTVQLVDDDGNCLVRLNDFSLRAVSREPGAKKQNHIAAGPASPLYFTPTWKRKTLAPGPGAVDGENECTLIFTDDESFYSGIGSAAKAAGYGENSQAWVRSGNDFSVRGNRAYAIDIREPQDYRELLADLARTGRRPARIVHAFALDPVFRTPQPLERCLEYGFHSLFYLTQALIHLKENKLRSHVLFLYPNDKTHPHPHFAAAKGYANTINRESTRVTLRTVEIAAGDPSCPGLMPASLVLDELKDASGGNIRYDGNLRYQAGLEQIELRGHVPGQDGPGSVIQRNGVYLITGGTGGIGMIFARYLARQYQAVVILSGRSAPGKATEQRVDEINALGGTAAYITADISDEKDVNRLVSEIRSSYGRINGVIHSAGVIRDAYIRDKTIRDVETVMAPKVAGTYFLDRALKTESLDFFVSFSAIASVLGNPGQCDYAYANGYLDSAAQTGMDVENRSHRNIISINWPLWENGGMKMNPQLEKMLSDAYGIVPLSDRAGIQTFEGVLMQDGPRQVMVMSGNHAKILDTVFPPQKGEMKPPPAFAGTGPGKMSAAGLRSHVERGILTLVMEQQQLKKEHIHLSQDMAELGYDSISLTALANLVNEKYALELSPAIFFELEYLSIRAFAEYLCEEYLEKMQLAVCGEDETNAIGAGARTTGLPASTGGKEPAEAPGEERLRSGLAQELLALAAKQQGLRKRHVDLSQDMTELGYDPVSLALFVNLVNDKFGLDVSSGTVLDLTPLSIEKFADYLCETFGEEVFAKRLPGEGHPEKKARTGTAEAIASPAGGPGETDVAIIGMSGIFPCAGNLDQFWKNLINEKCLISDFPMERLAPAIPGARESIRVKGGFVDDVDKFDSLFFNISPREAECTDPQQRLFLETVWRAIEDAGYRASDLWGTSTGVFVGASSNDYSDLARQNLAQMNTHSITGVHHAIISNRISFLFNFHGPSELVNTACSSSLAAVHHGVSAILSGLCDMAVAGGVNVILNPLLTMAISEAGMLSRDGRCKTFDKDADGYVRGEGAGAVLLKPLARAVRDNDHIYAVIKGTAVNHCGRSASLTSPNAGAQARLIEQAYGNAGVNPDAVGYIEVHGTGTSLGDPIEVNGLKKAFKALHKERGTLPGETARCGLGSVKTNIGHLEAAAGIAGLIKTALCLHYKVLPASINLKEINPHISLEGTPFYIVRKTVPWDHPVGWRDTPAPRVGGVSSFGFGGANTHIVLEEYVGGRAGQRDGAPAGPQVVVLSAKNNESLVNYAKNLIAFLKETDFSSAGQDTVSREENRAAPRHATYDLADIAYTLQTGREPMDKRVALVVSDPGELIDKLGAFVREEPHPPGLFRGNAGKNPRDKLLVEGEAGKEFIKILVKNRELEKLALLWSGGIDFDWNLVHTGAGRRRIPVPGYPFSKKRYWLPLGSGPANNSPEHRPQKETPPERPSGENGHGQPGDMTDYIIGLFGAISKVDPGMIGPDSDFETFGIDSLIIRELNRELGKRFGRLPATLFYEYKTARALAGYLSAHHKSAEAEIPDPAGGGPETASAAHTGPSKADGGGPNRTGIAVIGLAGKYPLAENMAEFWENLKNGRDCISTVPAQRWNYREYAQKGVYCKWGGFLSGVDKFDAAFFGISPMMAQYMSPQERLFLQTVWAAVEDAGYTRQSLGSERAGDFRGNVGVFAGTTFNEYQLHGAKEWEKGNIIPLSSQTYSIANRISYHFNFSGPSITVDTACSSSLYAVHLACESILRNECDMAVAGGVNLSLHPNKYVALCRSKFASSDGRCRSFAHGGDGYVPGEGVGAVLLKPLEKALRDRDQVYGVIRATASNHDGKTHGYSVPNPVAQKEVILAALGRSGIDPRTISYVEAHGTGTSLGDPIEISGLSNAYQAYTNDKNYCAVGSVKSNIGHSEAAAGIAQLTKVLLQMKYRMLVPSVLHSDRLNRDIPFSDTPFFVQRALCDWKPVAAGDRQVPMRAGISSFGAGGLNVHMIVEKACYESETGASRNRTQGGEAVLIVLSAKSWEILQVISGNLKSFLESVQEPVVLEDIAYTLQVGRERMAHRISFTAETVRELVNCLGIVMSSDPDGESLGRNGVFYAAPGAISGTVGRTVPVSGKSLTELAGEWVSGGEIEWPLLYKGYRPRRISLPTYPFSGKRHWIAAAPAPEDRTEPDTPSGKDRKPFPEGGNGGGAGGTDVEVLKRQLFAQLKSQPEKERMETVVAVLQKMAGSILGYDTSQAPSVSKGFFEMGMESVQTLMFMGQVEALFGVELYPTIAFDHPNISEFSEYVLPRLPFDGAPDTPVGAGAETVAERPENLYFSGVWRRLESDGQGDGGRDQDPGWMVLFDRDDEFYSWMYRRHGKAGKDFCRIILVKPGSGFKAVSSTVYEINPCGPEDYQLLFNAFQPRKISSLVYLWSRGRTESERKDPINGFDRGIYSLFRLSREILSQKLKHQVRILYFYFGAEHEIQPGYAALAGFAKTLQRETPRVSCRIVKVQDNGAGVSGAAPIMEREIHCEDREHAEIMYKDGGRHVRFLEAYEPRPAEGGAVPLRQGGVYVLTGGTGELGRMFAAYLASRVQAKIVLSGRSQVSPEKREHIDKIRELGSEVLFVKADITVREETAHLIETTRKKFKKINGIIHTAGVVKDAFIVNKTLEDLKQVVAPKVNGTVYLDEATADDDLDFFLMFSSMSAEIGNIGQCDYAFGNSFMDHFAASREMLKRAGRRTGKTISVNWPVWENGGMKAEEFIVSHLRDKYGFLSIDMAHGTEAFEKALACESAQLLMLRLDVNKIDAFTRAHPIFDCGRVPQERGPLPKQPSVPDRRESPGEFPGAGPERQAEEVDDDFSQKDEEELSVLLASKLNALEKWSDQTF